MDILLGVISFGDRHMELDASGNRGGGVQW
jgi:hypothetical protein